VSAFWTDPETGLELKARADMLNGMATCIDLKSAADASPHGFANAIARYRYHVQAALYLDAFGAERFVFVAGIYTLDDASVQQGRDEYRRALRGIAEHQQKDVWPSYGAQEISLPGWAFDYEDEVIV
jgi:predicted amidohydrolase